MADATTDCKPAIEQQATHDVKWADGFLTPMFGRLAWGNDSHTQVRFIGDKVEFQNGYGAYTPMTYFCDYDTSAKKVISVDVSEGRIPGETD